jgi:hypothetical protein
VDGPPGLHGSKRRADLIRLNGSFSLIGYEETLRHKEGRDVSGYEGPG